MNPQLERQTHISAMRFWRGSLTAEHLALRGEVEAAARQSQEPFSGMQALERLIRSCALAVGRVEQAGSTPWQD